MILQAPAAGPILMRNVGKNFAQHTHSPPHGIAGGKRAIVAGFVVHRAADIANHRILIGRNLDVNKVLIVLEINIVLGFVTLNKFGFEE